MQIRGKKNSTVADNKTAPLPVPSHGNELTAQAKNQLEALKKLKSVIADTDVALQTQERESQDKQQKLQEAKSSNQRKQADIEKTQAETARLQQEQDEMTKKVAQLKETLKAKNERFSEEIQTATAEFDKLNETLLEIQGRRDAAKRDSAQIEKELRSLDYRKGTLDDKIHTKKEDCSKLESELAALERKADSLNQRVASKKSELTEKESALRATEEKLHSTIELTEKEKFNEVCKILNEIQAMVEQPQFKLNGGGTKITLANGDEKPVSAGASLVHTAITKFKEQHPQDEKGNRQGDLQEATAILAKVTQELQYKRSSTWGFFGLGARHEDTAAVHARLWEKADEAQQKLGLR